MENFRGKQRPGNRYKDGRKRRSQHLAGADTAETLNRGFQGVGFQKIRLDPSPVMTLIEAHSRAGAAGRLRVEQEDAMDAQNMAKLQLSQEITVGTLVGHVNSDVVQVTDAFIEIVNFETKKAEKDVDKLKEAMKSEFTLRTSHHNVMLRQKQQAGRLKSGNHPSFVGFMVTSFDHTVMNRLGVLLTDMWQQVPKLMGAVFLCVEPKPCQVAKRIISRCYQRSPVNAIWVESPALFNISDLDRRVMKMLLEKMKTDKTFSQNQRQESREWYAEDDVKSKLEAHVALNRLKENLTVCESWVSDIIEGKAPENARLARELLNALTIDEMTLKG